jgi:hypothetical protein
MRARTWPARSASRAIPRSASLASSMFGGSAVSQRLPAPALAAIAASG